LSLPCLRWKLSLTRFNCQTNVCRKTWFPYFGGCAHFALFRCTQSNPWLSGNGLRLATCSWSGFPRGALVPHWSRMTPISDIGCVHGFSSNLVGFWGLAPAAHASAISRSLSRGVASGLKTPVGCHGNRPGSSGQCLQRSKP
jgi:hypothetical protein